MCVCAGVCDAGRYFDRDVDGARDNSVLRADAAAELHVEGGEVRGGGADHRRDGTADVRGYESRQLALERAERG